MKLVKGHGVYEKGRYKGYFNGNHTKEYKLWVNMLGRAYDKKHHEKHPTYTEIEVCDRWKNFQQFAEDINNMYGFNMLDEKGKSYCLDKDFLHRGNKIYSKENCVFIPNKINTFLTQKQIRNKNTPVGVSFKKSVNKYVATININGNQKHLGYFDNIHDCRMAYVIARNDYAREIAKEYRGKVDQRIIDILENYDEQDYTGAIEDLVNEGEINLLHFYFRNLSSGETSLCFFIISVLVNCIYLLVISSVVCPKILCRVNTSPLDFIKFTAKVCLKTWGVHLCLMLHCLP